MVREQGFEAEADVGVGAVEFAGEFFFNVGQLICEAAGIDENDAVLDDAVVFKVSVEGEEAEAPAGLAGGEKLFEPVFELVEAAGVSEGGEVVVEDGFDALRSPGDGEEAGPAADIEAGGREGDLLGNEGGSPKMPAGEALAAGALKVILAPHVANVCGEPYGAGEDGHGGLRHDAKKTQLTGGPFEEIAAEAERQDPFEGTEDPPNTDEGDDFRGRPFAFNDPVVRGVDHFADAFAEPFEAALGKFGRGVRKYSQLGLAHGSTIRLLQVGGYAGR